MIYSTELAVFVEKLPVFSGFSIRMGVSVEESGDLRPSVAHPLPLPWGPLQDGRLEAEASVFMFKRTL